MSLFTKTLTKDEVLIGFVCGLAGVLSTVISFVVTRYYLGGF